MLVRSQLEELARTLTNGNVGQTEKLYLQDIVLHSLYQNTANKLVFKGGTALQKLYNLDRFSEDLDFTMIQETNLDKVLGLAVEHLESLGAEIGRIEKTEKEGSFKTKLGVKGPLYTGKDLSLSFIRIEVNKKAKAKETSLKRYTPRFPDLSSFQLLILSQEEILAEKIRALVTRKKARDLYDIYHLLNKGIKIDKDLTQEKLDYYNLKFDREIIVEEAEKNRETWPDLRNLVFSPLPDFEVAIDLLKAELED